MNKEIIVKMSEDGGATPIAKLVQVANSFDSSIYLNSEGIKVNAKSIMGMMNLVISTGSKVTVDAIGNDEEAALDAIEKFLSESYEE